MPGNYAQVKPYVPLLAPADIGSTATATDVFHAGLLQRVEILVPFGAITGDAVVVTVEECDDVTPSNSTAIAFKYRVSAAVGTDSVGAVTFATASGASLAASDDNKLLIIDIDPSALSDGYPYVRAVVTPGGSMTVCNVAAVATGIPRYTGDGAPSLVV